MTVHKVTRAVIPLSSELINKECTKIGEQWSYHGPRVEEHGNPRTCIFALWQAGTDSIKTLCHTTATQAREIVMTVNDTTALWLVPNETRVTNEMYRTDDNDEDDPEGRAGKPTGRMHGVYTQLHIHP